MIEKNANELLRQLKHNPTVDDWKKVLAYAIDGEYNDLLDRLGGIESFVETSLANAISPVATKLAFETALNETAIAWQPVFLARYTATERILRLIAAKTPPAGFVKVLEQLIERRSFHISTEDASLNPSDLDDLAFGALQRYFPVPPERPDAFPAFEKYVNLLSDCLHRNGLRGHACQRLLGLGRLDVESKAFREVFEAFAGEVIPSLLSWLLNTQNPERQLLLSHLYRRTRMIPEARDLFQSELAKYGVRLEADEEPAYLILRSGETLRLWQIIEDPELAQRSKEWHEEAVQLPSELALLTSQEGF